MEINDKERNLISSNCSSVKKKCNNDNEKKNHYNNDANQEDGRNEAKSSWFSFSWSSSNSGKKEDIVPTMNNDYKGTSSTKSPPPHEKWLECKTPGRNNIQFYSTSPFREILRQKTPYLKVDPHPSLSPVPLIPSSYHSVCGVPNEIILCGSTIHCDKKYRVLSKTELNFEGL